MMQGSLSHKGSVLIMTLIMMLVLLVLVSTLIGTIVSSTRLQGGQSDGSQALYLAEAGISKAYYYLNNTAPDGSTNGSWTTSPYPTGTANNSSSACAGSNPCQEPLTLSSGTYSFTTYPTANTVIGTYTIWVNPITSGQYNGDIQIISQGVSNGIIRTVQEMLSKTTSSSLVGWWAFDEASSSTCTGAQILDSSGNGNTGTCSGGPAWTTGEVGSGAMIFNGGNYVQFASPSAFPTGSSARTMSAWFKLNSTTPGVAEIAGIGDNSGNGHRFSLLITNNSIGVEGENIGQDMTWTPDTNWHNLTAVFPSGQTDIAQTLLYLDGVLQTSNLNSTSGTLNTNNNDFVIGTIPGAHGYAMFSGIVDDFRIYNTALTASQVLEIYTHQNLAGWWKLTDGGGSSAADSSGFGNTGTLENSPSWTTGIVTPYALSFNGSNNYINVADTSKLQVETSAFSVSTWVNLLSQPSSGIDMEILFKCPTSQANDGFGFGYDNRSGTPHIDMWKSGIADQDVAYTLSNHTWYNLVAVQNFSGGNPSSIIYYVNGVNIGTYSNASSYNSSSGQALSIGAGNNTYGAAVPFNGVIDDTRIYNTALTADEVAAIYNGSNYSGASTFSVINGSWKECSVTGC